MISIELSWKKFLEKGDEPSFSVIYNNQVDDLYSYGLSLGFEKETCKDAIQDTFYKLYISRNNLHHVKNITAYIFKSFKHRLIDLAKRNTGGESIESVAESFTIHVTVLDDMIDMENAEIVKKKVYSLLGCLTANQREVVYLKYMAGLEHKEIAEILNIHEDSARKLLYRAMEKLRKQAFENNSPEKTELFMLLFFFHHFL